MAISPLTGEELANTLAESENGGAKLPKNEMLNAEVMKLAETNSIDLTEKLGKLTPAAMEDLLPEVKDKAAGALGFVLDKHPNDKGALTQLERLYEAGSPEAEAKITKYVQENPINGLHGDDLDQKVSELAQTEPPGVLARHLETLDENQMAKLSDTTLEEVGKNLSKSGLAQLPYSKEAEQLRRVENTLEFRDELGITVSSTGASKDGQSETMVVEGNGINPHSSFSPTASNNLPVGDNNIGAALDEKVRKAPEPGIGMGHALV